MPNATIKQIAEYFGMTMAEIRAEWGQLTDKDKADLKQGIGDGTLNY